MKKQLNKRTPLPKQECNASPDTSTGLTVPFEEVQRRAYAIFETRGGAPGHELDDWLRAEAEIEQK